MTELIITNGDSTTELMRKAGFEADLLPWRDVLHEGPVPKTPNLESLSAKRAEFLAATFDRPIKEVAQDIARRDRVLRDLDRYDAVTLWFEHDLYDQLQLLQILDFFHRDAGEARVHLVQAEDYLGWQTPQTIRGLAAKKASVSTEQKRLAADVFSAFRQPTPVMLAGFLGQELAPLPHMKAALKRLFEELPDSENGLSRTQRQALLAIDRNRLPPRELFGATQAMEDATFMGDWSFWRSLEELAFNIAPLIEGLPQRFGTSLAEEERRQYLDAELTLTDAGRAVLEGKADHAAINVIDRWLGGTHITHDAIWRWDRETDALVAPT